MAGAKCWFEVGERDQSELAGDIKCGQAVIGTRCMGKANARECSDEGSVQPSWRSGGRSYMRQELDIETQNGRSMSKVLSARLHQC